MLNGLMHRFDGVMIALTDHGFMATVGKPARHETLHERDVERPHAD